MQPSKRGCSRGSEEELPTESARARWLEVHRPGRPAAASSGRTLRTFQVAWTVEALMPTL